MSRGRHRPLSLSAAQARRIALAAQGFADPPHHPVTMRTLNRTVARTGVLQVDSVNVLARAHLMPLYSRMGGYDTALLTRAAQHRPRRLVEYWAHVQALMPVELWPVMQHRMAGYRRSRGKWAAVVAARPELAVHVLADVAAAGHPVTARDLEQPRARSREHWGWNWSVTRQVLDYLFMVGEVAVAGRTPSFEVRYDLPERVLPAHVLSAPVPTEHEAHRELVRRAARSHAVAGVRCLADYYRMSITDTERAVATLVESGELQPVTVQGWSRPAYLFHQARLPRRVEARTLLSPFDPVVWERSRAMSLFGFHYRIEIYVPAHRRQFGYYVLPFLLGDRLVARVDLKADRQRGVLLVRGAFSEETAPGETAQALADSLVELATWLGLAAIVVESGPGDLVGPLAALL